MSRSGKLSRSFDSFLLFGAAEKSQEAAEKMNKKMKLTALASH